MRPLNNVKKHVHAMYILRKFKELDSTVTITIKYQFGHRIKKNIIK